MKTEDALNWGLDVIEHIFGAPEDSLLVAQMVKQGTMLDPTLVVFKNMLLFNNEPEIYQNKDNYYLPVSVQQYWNSYRSDAKWLDAKLTSQNFESRKAYLQKCESTTGKVLPGGSNTTGRNRYARTILPAGVRAAR